MDGGIQKLKGFLAFGREKEREKRPATHAIHELLEALEPLTAIQAASSLTEQCIPAITATSNLHMRFKLLESLEPHLERCLPALEDIVGEAPLPLDESASAAALQADNLIKALAAAYYGLCSALTRQKMDSLLSHLLQAAARRAMHFLLRRQMLAYRAYATPSPSSWQSMHHLYATTRSMRLAQGGGERQTVEQVYLIALLLGFADTNKFRRKELGSLRALIEQLLPFAVLIDAAAVSETTQPSPSRFFVNTEEGSAGKPLARIPAGTPRAGHLVVECASIVAALDRVLNPMPGVALSLSFDAKDSTLLALRSALGGQMTRRFQRQRFRPKADLVFGLSQVIAFLDGRALSRRHSDMVIEIPPVIISEWSIIDESPDGFRLRYRKGEQQQFQVGDIVGLRQKDQSRIHICILRRIVSVGQGRLELGLQELGGKAQVIGLITSANRALFLPKLPAYDGRAGLLVDPGSLPDDLTLDIPGEGKRNEETRASVLSRITLNVPGETSSLRYRPESCPESNACMELHLLESLD